VAVISVQCLFLKFVSLLAVCAAAAVVRLRRRDFKNALIALAIGIPAAVSLLPYIAMIREAQDWSVLSQIGFLPPLIWTNLSLALAPTPGWLRWMWIALAVLAIARCVIHIFPDAVEDDADTAGFFAGTALIAGLIAFFIFLWVAKMPTQVWYFLPLTTFTAVCIDAAVANWPRAGKSGAVHLRFLRSLVCQVRVNLPRIDRPTWTLSPSFCASAPKRVISSSSIHGRLVFLSVVSILVRRRGPQFHHSRIIASIATIC
jgi:hypothetical protein